MQKWIKQQSAYQRQKEEKIHTFERKFPDELWQIDLKVLENGGKWLISIFEGHSRYVYYHLSNV